MSEPVVGQGWREGLGGVSSAKAEKQADSKPSPAYGACR